MLGYSEEEAKKNLECELCKTLIEKGKKHLVSEILRYAGAAAFRKKKLRICEECSTECLKSEISAIKDLLMMQEELLRIYEKE